MRADSSSLRAFQGWACAVEARRVGEEGKSPIGVGPCARRVSSSSSRLSPAAAHHDTGLVVLLPSTEENAAANLNAGMKGMTVCRR